MNILSYSRSAGKCNHIAGLLYKLHDMQVRRVKTIPSETACTSKQQLWHKPRESQNVTSEPVMKCIFSKSETDMKGERCKSPIKAKLYDARGQNCGINSDHIRSILDAIPRSAPFSYLLQPNIATPVTKSPFGSVPIGAPLSYQLTDVKIDSLEFFTSTILSVTVSSVEQDLSEYPDLPIYCINPTIDFTSLQLTLSIEQKSFLLDLQMPLSEAQILEKSTCEQSKSPLWVRCRSNRLTSSNFGQIMIRKADPTDVFLRNIFAKKDLTKVKSIAYGRVNESIARKLYVKQMKKNLNRHITVFDSGLIINPGYYFLGASPDGKVIDFQENPAHGLIEIKCPFSQRNVNLKQAVYSKDFFLEYTNNVIQLKRSHVHYFQVQGQLALSNCDWCDFIVYTNKSLFVERIRFDRDLWENEILPKLCKFYFHHAVPYLTK